jgi:hypothetical protein
VTQIRNRLLAELKPDGFNIGVNDGLSARQVVDTRMQRTQVGRLTVHCVQHWSGSSAAQTRPYLGGTPIFTPITSPDRTS